MKKFLNRKDIADLLECTVTQVRKNEKRLGLVEARRDLNPRCVRYLATLALRNLEKRGFLASEVALVPI